MRCTERISRQRGCRLPAGAKSVGFLVAAALSSFSLDVLADTGPMLPEGAGRELVEHKCAQCHSLETVMRSRRTRKQWEAQLDTMIARGLRLSDEEFERVADYLASGLGPPATE